MTDDSGLLFWATLYKFIMNSLHFAQKSSAFWCIIVILNRTAWPDFVNAVASCLTVGIL